MQQLTIQKKVEANGIDAAIQAIQSGANELLIRGNQIGAAGANALAEALKTNASLTSLDLTDNRIGDIGANALAEALRTNPSLTTLNLGSNQIGAAGANALAEALKTNTSLTSLNLWGNQIGDIGANALIQAELNTNRCIPQSTAKKTAVTFLCIIGRLTNKLLSPDVLTYILQGFARTISINKGPYRFSPLTQVPHFQPPSSSIYRLLRRDCTTARTAIAIQKEKQVAKQPGQRQ